MKPRLLFLSIFLLVGAVFGSVPSSTTWVQYTLTTNPQTLTVPFVFQNASDLLVIDSKASPPVTLTLNSDYSVSGGSGSTGTISTIAGGANAVQVGDKITISRRVPLTQTTSFVTGGPLTPAMIGQTVDKLTTIAQQLNLVGANSLQFQGDEQISGVLPLSLRANAFLAFDTTGRPWFPTTASIVGTVANPIVAASIAALKVVPTAGLTNNASCSVAGYYIANDGGGGVFIWNSTSTSSDNGGTIIQPAGVATGRWIRQFSGALNVRWFGAKGDGSNDDTSAILATITALSSKGGTVFVPQGVYSINSTIALPPNCTVQGQYAGNGAAGPQDKTVGSVLKWTGATSSTAVSIVAATNVEVDGINIDGNSTSGLTGFLIDSNASNQGPENIIIARWTAWDCAVGLQWGTTGATPSYQNDSVKISEFKVYNTSQGFGDGIVINSDQAAQGSIIENGICENIRNGINVQHAGGTFKIRGVLFGALSGTDITLNQTLDVLVENCHHEQGAKAVDVVGSNFLSGTITFINNHWFNEPVTVGRQANIVSISNAGGSTATCTVAGTTVVSVSDTFNSGNGWTMTQGKQFRVGSLAQISADGTITSNTGPGFVVNSVAGQIRSLGYKTSGVNRWLAYCTDDPETGSNAGSDYALVAYADDGSFLWAPIVARRQSGAVAVRGTQTNDDAGSGNYGEWGRTATGSPGAALSNGVAQNVVSITLSPGDWEITGNCVFGMTGATVTALVAGSNNVSATFPLPVYYSSLYVSGAGISAAPTAIVPTQRYTVASGSTTTVYLVAQANFSAGTVNVYGYIAARRMR